MSEQNTFEELALLVQARYALVMLETRETERAEQRLYTAFAAPRALSTDDLLAEAARTRPLSRVMPERLTALRQWAGQRTVGAD